MTVSDVTNVLDQAGATYEVLRHEHTERALDEAEALGVPAQDVAKTLVVTIPEGHLRAVIPADERIDLAKLRRLVGVGKRQIHLASEEELASEYSEFELGAVPPFGGRHQDRAVLDSALAERESVVFEAGTHDESLRVPVRELIRVAGAEVADICIR